VSCRAHGLVKQQTGSDADRICAGWEDRVHAKLPDHRDRKQRRKPVHRRIGDQPYNQEMPQRPADHAEISAKLRPRQVVTPVVRPRDTGIAADHRPWRWFGSRAMRSRDKSQRSGCQKRQTGDDKACTGAATRQQPCDSQANYLTGADIALQHCHARVPQWLRLTLDRQHIAGCGGCHGAQSGSGSQEDTQRFRHESER
jgi:hypothetical protein